MKKLSFILITLIAVSCNSKKTEIVDQLFLYRDSLGMAKAQKILMQMDSGIGEHKLINLKAPINERIYRYEWKIDSLELELKKY